MRIGIDLGGTKTEGIVLDRRNQIIKRIRRRTPQALGYQAILKNIACIVSELEQISGQNCTVGIGTPGSIDNRTGCIKYSNTICLNNKPIQNDLEQLLNKTVRIENDANCFTLSESIDGAAKDANTVFGIILGTGVGGSIVINKKIMDGPNGMSGEWGHIPLHTNGDPCYCGQIGCIETYLSGPALVKSFNDEHINAVCSVEEIVQLSRSGNPLADKVIHQYYENFAKAISIIVKVIDPEIIVLGGGLSNMTGLYKNAILLVENYFCNSVKINLVKNKHGDSSGVRGAAFLFDPILLCDRQ